MWMVCGRAGIFSWGGEGEVNDSLVCKVRQGGHNQLSAQIQTFHFKCGQKKVLFLLP